MRYRVEAEAEALALCFAETGVWQDADGVSYPPACYVPVA